MLRQCNEWFSFITGGDPTTDGLGNVYISGRTGGDLGGANAGDTDAFVAKFAILRGDFNDDGVLDVKDIDDLTIQSAGMTHPLKYDLTEDRLVNREDVRFWVTELRQSWIGDANLDGEFNSGDLVAVFEAGEYEDDIELNSGWAAGDWNGDGDFTSRDLVLAFEDGGYEQGTRVANAVPEPSTLMHTLCALLLVRPRRFTNARVFEGC